MLNIITKHLNNMNPMEVVLTMDQSDLLNEFEKLSSKDQHTFIAALKLDMENVFNTVNGFILKGAQIMSASKEFYATMQGPTPVQKEKAIFDVGQRFTINFGFQKVLRGTWEIVDTSESPFYICVKVLKNGKLSKSNSQKCKRNFYVSYIKQALGD
ncbi:hypothetical protein [Bacillus velezensis]|uniref:hypothetical protein n=1 Tax=Bacillus velezensis TaxID=492670 RepID=UPI001A9317A1|nr:hypothetical protein [Bacillus velezensis]BCT30468.1 hypothetical protein BVAD3_41420 [Bacillus velezensis]